MFFSIHEKIMNHYLSSSNFKVNSARSLSEALLLLFCFYLNPNFASNTIFCWFDLFNYSSSFL